MRSLFEWDFAAKERHDAGIFESVRLQIPAFFI